MATKFTAFIWPPLIFPLPVNIGAGKYALSVLATFPPLAFPPSLAARTSKVATAAAPAIQPFVLPAPVAYKQTFTPAATTVSRVGQAKIVNPNTTQDQINTFFRIQSPRPGSGT